MLDDCCTSLQTADTKLQICFNYIITSVLNFNNDYKSLKVFLGYCHLLLLVWQIEILRESTTPTHKQYKIFNC